jgi:hypothetical protein
VNAAITTLMGYPPSGRQSSNTQRENGECGYSTAMRRAWKENADNTFAQNPKVDHEGFPILDPYVLDVFRLPCNLPTSVSSIRVKHRGKIINSPTRPLLLAPDKQMLEQNAALSELALLLEESISPFK